MKKIYTSALCVVSALSSIVPLSLSSCSQTFKISKLVINGSLDGISKDKKVKVNLQYSDLNGVYNFSADAKMKLQGRFSVDYFPKKNYNIELYEVGSDYSINKNVKLTSLWNEDNKYTIKGNYSDSLGVHNIVGSKLWGDVVHQNKYIPELNSLLNGGAIDGFPIALYNNNDFMGLYSFNLKKGKNLFNMNEGAEISNAIIQGHEDNEYTFFKKTIDDIDNSGWEIEFCSTGESKEESSWVITNFNKFINFVNTSTDADFKTNLSTYTSPLFLIDYYLYLEMSAAWDNIGNNAMWVTYDGNIWYPCVYDFDESFGLNTGNIMDPHVDINLDKNLLFERLSSLFKNEIKNEWSLLRKQSLTIENINRKFDDFISLIPKNLYKAEKKKWPDAEWRKWKNNTIENLKTFVAARIDYLDSKYK